MRGRAGAIIAIAGLAVAGIATVVWAVPDPVKKEGGCPTPASLASPRTDLPDWEKRHAKLVTLAEAGPRAIMLGDSITERMPADLARAFVGDDPLNTGIGGDQLPNIIWRAERMKLSSAQRITLLGGVNDLAKSARTPEEVAASLLYAVSLAHSRAPRAHVSVFKILPTGLDKGAAIPTKIAAVNKIFGDCVPRAAWLSIYDLSAALSPTGEPVTKDLESDGIHPTRLGYEKLVAVRLSDPRR